MAKVNKKRFNINIYKNQNVNLYPFIYYLFFIIYTVLYYILYTGCPKKNYTLFDFMYRKTYYSYFTKIKSIVFTKD